MPLILPGNVASATTAAYEVANSCRFNDGDSAYMSRTLGTPTNNDRWTFSCWIKRGNVDTQQVLFAGSADANNGTVIQFKNTEQLQWQEYQSSFLGKYTTNRLFRDPSAWYHLVFTYDSGNATAGDRMRIYVNGTEETSFADEVNVDQNQDSLMNTAVAHGIGYDTGTGIAGSYYFDGYMAEAVFCDGQAYAASDFGEFDSDSPSIWKPKDPSGLTFGNNGFYLDFEASDNLGNDANGGTDWAESNLAAVDQATDTPTNNFCVINPLAGDNDENTLSEGNCKIVSTATGSSMGGTFGLSAGKWYWEAKLTASNTQQIGIMDVDKLFTRLDRTPGAAGSNGFIYLTTGNVYNNDSQLLTGLTSSTTNDIISVALDITNLKIYWYKNDSLLNSGGTDITTGLTWFPITGAGGGSDRINQECNFGGCSAFTVSSGNADADGYGNFEYAVPSGYYAICTKNLGAYGG